FVLRFGQEQGDGQGGEHVCDLEGRTVRVDGCAGEDVGQACCGGDGQGDSGVVPGGGVEGGRMGRREEGDQAREEDDGGVAGGVAAEEGEEVVGAGALGGEGLVGAGG